MVRKISALDLTAPAFERQAPSGKAQKDAADYRDGQTKKDRVPASVEQECTCKIAPSNDQHR